jgi:hypothetical protein
VPRGQRVAWGGEIGAAGALEELLRPMEETANAAMKSAIVIALRRWGVSQVTCRACSQVRAPVAPAAAAIAHAPHMPAIVRIRGLRLPARTGHIA